MSRTVTQIDVSTDTFELWVNKTNDLLLSLSTEIITANDDTANTGTIAEPRRAQLHGKFGANTLVATNNLRGGNVGDTGSALLTISSNTTVGGNSTIGNSSFFHSYANVLFENVNTQVNAQIITVTGNTYLKGNTSVITFKTLGNSTITNTSINGTDFYVSTGTIDITGNTYIKANSSVTLIQSLSNGTTANSTLGGNLVTISANLNVGGNVINNLTVLANTLLVGSVTYANTVFTYNDYVTTSFANSNLGSETSLAQTIFQFDKSLYSSAKIISQIKNTGNTQTSEMVLAHDGTSVYVTVYGTVVSPTNADLGDYSASVISGNVHLLFKQNAISSSSKVIATLIK